MNAILLAPCLRALIVLLAKFAYKKHADRLTYSCVNEKALAVKMKAQPNKKAARILADDNNRQQ